jgi:HlyD family secretion protein
MTGRKFLSFIGVILLITAVVYYFTTPSGKYIPLTGVIDGNEVVVSPQITGRIVNLTVDEGSVVKKGVDATLSAAKANVDSLEEQVNEANHNYSWTNGQTDASVTEAEARVASAKAQLGPTRAQLGRDQDDLKRMQQLFDKGEVSAQDRDHAEAAVKISQASVEMLEEAVKAAAATQTVAQENRKQVAARESAVNTTIAQARATAAQVSAQLGYTKVYAPIDGIVSVRVARQGEVVAQGSPIVVIVDVDHLWVHADVEESYIDSIEFGQKLRIKLPSGDMLEGPVFFKGVENDFATQRDVSRTKRDIKTFAIKVSIPNPGRRLFTGMTATVLLPPPARKSWFARS